MDTLQKDIANLVVAFSRSHDIFNNIVLINKHWKNIVFSFEFVQYEEFYRTDNSRDDDLRCVHFNSNMDYFIDYFNYKDYDNILSLLYSIIQDDSNILIPKKFLKMVISSMKIHDYDNYLYAKAMYLYVTRDYENFIKFVNSHMLHQYKNLKFMRDIYRRSFNEHNEFEIAIFLLYTIIHIRTEQDEKILDIIYKYNMTQIYYYMLKTIIVSANEINRFEMDDIIDELFKNMDSIGVVRSNYKIKFNDRLAIVP